MGLGLRPLQDHRPALCLSPSSSGGEKLSSFRDVIYGPVSSWRFGRSLGVDLICQTRKLCSFDCIYCSLGRAKPTIERRVFVSVDLMETELKKAIERVDADIVTFSGTGEPTLAKNLGSAISAAKEISGLPVAVLTNSSLMSRKDVRADLAKADVVKGKLDVPNEELFHLVNRPHKEIGFADVIEGMRRFRREFKGKFAVEVMFVEENVKFSKQIADLIRSIDPDEVQINTPLRPSSVRPLSKGEIERVLTDFSGMNLRWVYESERPKIVGKIVGMEKIKKLKRVD